MLAMLQMRPSVSVRHTNLVRRVSLGIPKGAGDRNPPGPEACQASPIRTPPARTPPSLSQPGARVPCFGHPLDAAAPPTSYVESVRVAGGVTMELTCAQWWMSLGDTEVHLRVEFHGLTPSSGTSPLYLDGRNLYAEFELSAPFRRTPAEPSGSLTRIERAVRPHACKLLPPVEPLPGAPSLGDKWPSDQRVIYDYLLGYKFALKEKMTTTSEQSRLLQPRTRATPAGPCSPPRPRANHAIGSTRVVDLSGRVEPLRRPCLTLCSPLPGDRYGAL